LRTELVANEGKQRLALRNTEKINEVVVEVKFMISMLLFDTAEFSKCQKFLFLSSGIPSRTSTCPMEVLKKKTIFKQFLSAHIIDKGKFRARKTLESWHTAITSDADNNAKQLPRQHSILL